MSARIHPTLKRFLWDIQSMVELTDDAREILLVGSDLMARLIASDDWLPEAFAAAAPEGPRQYQLFADGAERFCVVSAVLGKSQALPVLREPHWQIAGVLRGAVSLEPLAIADDGSARAAAPARALGRGAVERLSAKPGTAFRFSNPADEPAITIHVHGAEIGASARYVLAADGRLDACAFGYANPADSPAYDIWSIQTTIED